MNETEDTAVDAINDALEVEAPEVPEDDLPEIPLEEDGDEAAETEDAEGEDTEPSEEDPDGVELDAAGKPIAKATEKPVKKPADPVNDPIPKGLKQETSDRIRTLIKTTRDLSAERDAVRTEFDTIVNGIRQTGATPEQYGEVLNWVSLFNSPNVEAKRQAYQLVEDVAARMALTLGIERTSLDPLAKHADLKDAVAKGQITPVYAKELARQRDQMQFRSQIDTHQQTTQQQQQAQQQEVAAARSSLNALEQQLRTSDPLYDRKRAQLVPVLRPLFQQLRPSQWAAAFQESYKNLRLQRAAPVAAPAAIRGQPMRAKGSGGAHGRAASSALEAVNGALASMGQK